MKNTLIPTALAILFVFASCSNALDKQFSVTNYNDDMSEIVNNQLINDREVKMIHNYIALSKLEHISLSNKTYNDILVSAKADNSLEEKLAKEQAAEEVYKRNKLGGLIVVDINAKNYIEDGQGNYMQYAVEIINKTKKNIKSVSGSISIFEPNNIKLKTININENESIEAFQTKKSIYTTNFYKSIEEDNIIQYADLKSLKVVWTPERIIYDDGTMIE